MNIEIITVGTELLNGRKCDSHAQWLGGQLQGLGLKVRFHTSVADDAADLELALRAAVSRSRLVLVSGGLGPTVDDITREVSAKVAGLALREDPQVKAWLEGLFRDRQRPMPANNLRQAMVPEGAQVLPNSVGTAPGLKFMAQDATLVLLPGPPGELQAVFEASVLPWLKSQAQPAPRFERSLCTWGLGESAVDAALAGLTAQGDTRTLSMLAHEGMVEVRLSCSSREELVRLEAAAAERLGDAHFSSDGKRLEEVVLQMLLARRSTLALAESCTGGRVAAKITAVPGASKALLAGMVTYSDASKEQFLEVPPYVLKRSGAVSKETALAMAVGLARATGADYCLSVTGIAGPAGLHPAGAAPGAVESPAQAPDGGSQEKPVGSVHFALASPDGVAHQEYRFGPDTRASIQSRAAMAALFLLYRSLSGLPIPETPQDRASLPGHPPSA